MPQICPKCGKESIENAKFCIVCGESLHIPAPGGKTRICLLLDNRYEVLNVVKPGAMGCIYRARDTRLNNTVAIKKMFSSPESLVDQEYAEKRFEEEAKLLSALHHSGLPKVFDYFKETDPETQQLAHYLVMTFIEGSDFETIIKNRNRAPFPIDEAIAYFRQILLILNYLHTQKPPIIYRDLNPRNIMLSNGSIFMVDFGIARVFKPEKKGTAIGTPGYASPEQYKGEAEPRSDLFSLGVVMHYLLTGRDPEDSSQQIFKFQPIRQINPSVPEYLESIIMSLLSIVPDQRPRSAQEVIQTLNANKRPQTTTKIAQATPEPPITQPTQKMDNVENSHLPSAVKYLHCLPWALIPVVLVLFFLITLFISSTEKESDSTSTVTYTPSTQIQATRESTDNERTAEEREVLIPDPTPSFSQQRDPVTCVQFYYSSINMKNFRVAYELESERSRSKTSYEKWYQDIWSNNVSIDLRKQELKSNKNGEAEVTVELTSMDKIKATGKEEQAVYSGTVKLILYNGGWYIDGFSIAPKKES